MKMEIELPDELYGRLAESAAANGLRPQMAMGAIIGAFFDALDTPAGDEKQQIVQLRASIAELTSQNISLCRLGTRNARASSEITRIMAQRISELESLLLRAGDRLRRLMDDPALRTDDDCELGAAIGATLRIS